MKILKKVKVKIGASRDGVTLGNYCLSLKEPLNNDGDLKEIQSWYKKSDINSLKNSTGSAHRKQFINQQFIKDDGISDIKVMFLLSQTLGADDKPCFKLTNGSTVVLRRLSYGEPMKFISESKGSAQDGADKVAADKEAADKEAAEKEAADKIVADKFAADNEAAYKVAADKAVAADKEVADKLIADKEAAEKEAADKIAADKLEASKVAGNKPNTGGRTTPKK